MDNHAQRGKYAVDLPYPELDGVEKNLKYALVLQDDYAGMASEFTTIAQYCYQNFVNDGEDRSFADDLIGIAKVEMKHLELLGEAIIKLGGYALFKGTYSGRGRFWNGAYVHYSRDMEDILADNMKAEREAILNYENHVEIIQDIQIQSLLNRIILDEELHLKLFEDYHKNLSLH